MPKNVLMNMTENISKKNDKITGENINLDKISLGNPEKKNSGKFKFEIIPILYDEKPFQIVECGKMKIFPFHNKSFSVGLTVDKENEDYLKSIEKRISDLFDVELNLIKSSHRHSKVYAKRFAIEGQIQTPVRILSNGKKRLVNPSNYIGVPFNGKIVNKVAKIYLGSCLSLVCEAKEVLIEEIQSPGSYFDEYSELTTDLFPTGNKSFWRFPCERLKKKINIFFQFFQELYTNPQSRNQRISFF